MVIIFPYDCLMKKKPAFLVEKRCGTWPTGLLNSEAVNLDLAKLIPDEADRGNDPDDDTQALCYFHPLCNLFLLTPFPCTPEAPQGAFSALHSHIITTSHLLPLM